MEASSSSSIPEMSCNLWNGANCHLQSEICWHTSEIFQFYQKIFRGGACQVLETFHSRNSVDQGFWDFKTVSMEFYQTTRSRLDFVRLCDNLSWHGGYGPLLSLFEHLEVPKIHRLPIVWPGLSKTPAPLGFNDTDIDCHYILFVLVILYNLYLVCFKEDYIVLVGRPTHLIYISDIYLLSWRWWPPIGGGV